MPIQPRRRGRPRQFDYDEALAAALQTFWHRGFTGTSVEHLTTAMRLNRPSLYAAFGNKDAAYAAAIDHYVATIGREYVMALHRAAPLRASLTAFFTAVIDVVTGRQGPTGCAIVCTLPAEAGSSPAARRQLARVLADIDAAVIARLRTARAAGELPASTNLPALAQLVAGTMINISIRARSGVSRGELTRIARSLVDLVTPDRRSGAEAKQTPAAQADIRMSLPPRGPVLLALLGLALTSSAVAGAAVSPKEAREIAKRAYIYGVPMVDVWRTMYAYSLDTGGPQYRGPFNTILNIARVFTPDDTAFVTPNSDTPYSFAGLDLRAEPVVITVPKIDGHRYFVFQLMDLYTFNFAYIGSRATGNDGGHFLIAGPHWRGKTPEGIDAVIGAETDLVTRCRPHAALQSGRPRPREGDPGRVPGRAALDLSRHAAATGAAGGAMAEADAGGGGAHVARVLQPARLPAPVCRAAAPQRDPAARQLREDRHRARKAVRRRGAVAGHSRTR